MTQKPELDHRLLHEQVNLLYEQSYIASAGAITASLATGAIFWTQVAHWQLIVWTAAAIAVTLVRFGFARRYRRLNIDDRDAVRWKQLFIRMIFISGFIWGSSAFLVFSGKQIGRAHV